MLQRGAVLSGKYRIESVLGEGGMAVVYAVTHLRNTARLAVKVLNEGSLLKGNIRARFVREGKVANSVNHPGAVQMIDDGVSEDGSPYLVMEHLNGVSVDQLASRPIPLSAALNVVYQALDVLRAAHDNGIIHRDIKPANLFVLRNGRVKVLDFGISRLHDGAEPFDSQATGSVMGTPFFMAPEQARSDASGVDTRTDLFAVGATLFTLISGEYLHTGDDSRQVMIQAATRQARSLATVAPRTPPAVVDLVAKAVAYDNTARWESAEAMQEAVRQVHEALCGPIEFEALAMLLREREFRRKSHARLTAPLKLLPWASSYADASPLSTTLPAVAAVTRKVESYRAADSASNREQPSSRISAEPLELAGWTGQVPAPVQPGKAAGSKGFPFARAMKATRVVQVGAFALAAAMAVFGLTRVQTPPVQTTKPVLARDAAPLAGFGPAASPAVMAEVAPALAPSAALSANAARPARRAPALRDASIKTSSPGAPSPPAVATAERLKIAPTLIRPVSHAER